MPSLGERLEGSWCVSSITLSGKPMTVRTVHRGFSVKWEGCEEYIRFATSGVLTFPGLASPEISANWRVLRGDLIVQDADTLNDVLDGSYTVDLNGDHLNLRNGDLLVRADRVRFRSPF